MAGYLQNMSMSVNAAEAYADGEMPKSKWTKKAMVAAIKECCDDDDLFYDKKVEKLTKPEMFNQFFWRSSWHHTSKFFNVTDFYSLDDEEVCDFFRPMTDAEIQERNAAREKAWEEREKERKAQEEAERAYLDRCDAYRQEHGFAPDCAAAFILAHPEQVHEYVSTHNKRHYCFTCGNQDIDVTDKSLTQTHVWEFDAVNVTKMCEENQEVLSKRRKYFPSAADVRASVRAARKNNMDNKVSNEHVHRHNQTKSY